MRLLSRSHADAIRRVTIRNAHGRYYSYGVGLTYFHRKVAERGLMDRISVIDCGLAKASTAWRTSPAAPGTTSAGSGQG